MLTTRLFVALPLCAAIFSCTGDSKPKPPASNPPASAAPVSIVGTWEYFLDLERIVRKSFKHTKPNATEEEIAAAVKAQNEQTRAQGSIPKQTYRADGTGESSGMVFDHHITDQFTWKLIEATSERIVIDAWTANNIESRMTFLIESPDVLVYADKPMKGQKIVRVK